MVFFPMRMYLAFVLALALLGCMQTGNSGTPTVTASATPNFEVETKMAVKTGDTVKVDYIGSTEGKVFDTSIQAEAKKANLPPRPSYEPLEFKVGAGQVVPGFDKSVLGLKVGEEKTVTFPPKEGYGEKDPQLIVNVSADNFEDKSGIKVGAQVYAPSGQPGTITTVDFNHFLAGKTLTFKVILRQVK